MRGLNGTIISDSSMPEQSGLALHSKELDALIKRATDAANRLEQMRDRIYPMKDEVSCADNKAAAPNKNGANATLQAQVELLHLCIDRFGSIQHEIEKFI